MESNSKISEQLIEFIAEIKKSCGALLVLNYDDALSNESLYSYMILAELAKKFKDREMVLRKRIAKKIFNENNIHHGETFDDQINNFNIKAKNCHTTYLDMKALGADNIDEFFECIDADELTDAEKECIVTKKSFDFTRFNKVLENMDDEDEELFLAEYILEKDSAPTVKLNIIDDFD